jgi:poly-gamma-glutamate capsule biosynthesis protein CapA/YwtB (metallophosphatase superfamily)
MLGSRTARAFVTAVAIGLPAAAHPQQLALDTGSTERVESEQAPKASTKGADRGALAASSAVGTGVPDKEADDTITIVLVGDTGLGGHLQPVDPRGAYRHGSRMPWSDLTARIAPAIDGDLNFANLESVVTDRNDLRPEDKTFVFRSHPDGIRHLADIGFNMLSTANNHAMDFGLPGLHDTLGHLNRIATTGAIRAHSGLGLTRDDAGRPRLLEAKGAKIGFAAIGIVSSGFAYHRATATRPGQLAVQAPEDFDDVTSRLAEAPVAYRILSVHHGEERAVRASPSAIQNFRRIAVKQRGIDLVVGHHAHVAAGVEMVDGRLIFYGLGNFLHPGMQNMSSFGMCRDYGVLARVHLRKSEAGRLEARAVEVLPVTDMHWQTRRLDPKPAGDRVQVLNHLARQFDDPSSGAVGLRFTPQADGSGLFCAAGAGTDSGHIGRLCSNWQPAVAPSPSLALSIARSCGNFEPLVARSDAARRPGQPALTVRSMSRPVSPWSERAARAATTVADAP